MSTRNIRKLREKLKKDDDSDVSLEDFEPGFTKKSQSGFGGLLVNSESENEETHTDNLSENSSSGHEAVVAKTGKQTKRKTNKHKKNKSQNIGVTAPSHADNYDEIDQVVAEVNTLLGEPEQAASTEVSDNKDSNNPLRVIAKHINVEYELLRLFGPNEDDERRNRRQRPRLLRRLIVQPNDNFVFSVKGLKMSLVTIKDGVKYFVFEHGPEYVKNMKKLLKILEIKYVTGDLHEPHVFTTDTIEAVLENNDIFYAMEALDMGRPTLEETIFFLQGIFHPKFNFTDENIRLEYKYVENRMFHVALLKYLHLLTNKACHRTALEIAKLLLNLDPSDPLGVILIIDTLALRAREHQWFIELYKHWEQKRGAKHLFHMRFSYAMALFHVATKTHNEDKISEADNELQMAILEYPLVVSKILDCASQKIEDVSNSELFQRAVNKTSEQLKGLIILYAKFTWPRWREPNVWKWLTKNTCAIINSYKDNVAVQIRGDELATQRFQLFKTYPLQIKRHLNTITPMSQLLVDGAVPSVERSVSHNPYPDLGESIDTNQYYTSWGVSTALGNIFRILLRSMAPEPFRGGNVLCLHENAATVVYHIFIMMCYTMPLVGAILADNFIGRYKVILYFSIIYLMGTIFMCCSAIPPLMLPPTSTSMTGLALIATGTGGIKPCVAAFGGDQFRLPEENQRLQRFFSTFYCTVNLGGFMGMVITPALRRSVMCFGDDTCYALGFGFPAILVLISIVIFVAGKPWYRIKQPRDNITLKFVSCAWYAFTKRLKYDPKTDGVKRAHWLDYSIEKYGEKLVEDMKVVFAILYLYLPVPIFWSLFDQQGSRWTFQASRLKSEVLGITLMPDQLQVMNPAMVLFMIPVCPGGAWPILPDLEPLQKMFLGGILAALAFVSAGILQIGIERSTLQLPGRHQTGLVLLNSLGCPVEITIRGEGVVPVEQHGTALMTPLPHRVLTMTATCPIKCAGRVMKKNMNREDLVTVAGTFMPVVIGQNSNDQIAFYYMDPNPFIKSLTGKPKLKVVYVGDTGPNKNVSIAVETEKRLSDIYYVSDAPVDHIGESAYMCLQPGKFKWQAQSADGEVTGSGEGYLRAGGVYVLCVRERLGRLDAAVLHAPNPPNELHLAWIVPQYLLVSVAEIMFAVSGLEFSFTQAPKSMKTITIAAWYVSVAFGNLIVILVAQAKIFQSRATEFFVYAGVLAAAMLVFLRMAQGYQSRSIEGDGSSSESRPLLHHRSRVISVHSLSTIPRPYSGPASSAASCLGMMDRSRPAAWPARAYVNLATPSTSDRNVTTTLARN